MYENVSISLHPGDLRHASGSATVTVTGELDHTNVRHLTRGIRQALAAQPNAIVVDLDGASFISAALLGTLVAARKRCRRDGVRLTVRCTDPRLRRLFTITDLESALLDDAQLDEGPLDHGPLDGARLDDCRLDDCRLDGAGVAGAVDGLAG